MSTTSNSDRHGAREAVALLPAPPNVDWLYAIRRSVSDRTVVVLDDDPTGTQTVRDVIVLTDWPTSIIQLHLEAAEPLIYLLTNSRSLPKPAAVQLARDIGHRLTASSGASGRPISIISRSDSTLRGHFPAEVDAVADGAGLTEARILLVPFFGDGGRVTINDVHYVRLGRDFIPVAETEFAADPVFGYRNSDLRAWVGEKSGDERAVSSVSVTDLRTVGPTVIPEALERLPPGGVCIVNAVTETDVEIAALGHLEAELGGLSVIVRSASSFVRARAGQPVHAPLAIADLDTGTTGLIIVGSHVQTTTAQVTHLFDALPALRRVDLPVEQLLDPATAENVISAAAKAVDAALRARECVVVMTSRALVRGRDADADLDISSRVSNALSSLVARVPTRPTWLLAKGGVTSSDLATNGLGVRQARVLGQLVPGVPVWRCGPEARWPGLAYVVFPGNVGAETTLSDAVGRLAGDGKTAP